MHTQRTRPHPFWQLHADFRGNNEMKGAAFGGGGGGGEQSICTHFRSFSIEVKTSNAVKSYQVDPSPPYDADTIQNKLWL